MSVFCVISSVCLSVSDCAEMELDGENGRFIAEWLGYFCDACRMVYGGILLFGMNISCSVKINEDKNQDSIRPD